MGYNSGFKGLNTVIRGHDIANVIIPTYVIVQYILAHRCSAVTFN